MDSWTYSINICCWLNPENTSSDKPQNAILGFAYNFTNTLAKDVGDRKFISLAGDSNIGQIFLKITISENTGQSNSLKMSHVGAQKTSTKIIACDERPFWSQIQRTWWVRAKALKAGCLYESQFIYQLTARFWKFPILHLQFLSSQCRDNNSPYFTGQFNKLYYCLLMTLLLLLLKVTSKRNYKASLLKARALQLDCPKFKPWALSLVLIAAWP